MFVLASKGLCQCQVSWNDHIKYLVAGCVD